MAGVNKAILVGTLGGDPEIRYTQNGLAVVNFSLATSESWTKDGEKHDKTEWHKVVAFGKLAEICGEYLVKGKQVYIEGRIQTRKWEDKEGTTRYTTEIVANQMTMLGSKGDRGDVPSGGGGGKSSGGSGGGSGSGGGGGGSRAEEPPPPDLDDIPF